MGAGYRWRYHTHRFIFPLTLINVQVASRVRKRGSEIFKIELPVPDWSFVHYFLSINFLANPSSGSFPEI
jgi:hypothetical protein